MKLERLLLTCVAAAGVAQNPGRGFLCRSDYPAVVLTFEEPPDSACTTRFERFERFTQGAK
jgi:hypothetical protein